MSHSQQHDAPMCPPMLVMTSGNIHDEPIVTSDEEAYRNLAGIADAFIGNDRKIVSRFDDSVLRVIQAGPNEQAIQFFRRARGYAPAPITVRAAAQGSGTIFATGPEQKNTFAFLRPTMSGDGVNGMKPEQPDVTSTGAEGGAERSFCDAGQKDSSATLGMTSGRSPQVGEDACCEGCDEGPSTAEAFVSQHIGDMENAETFDAWLEAKRRYEQLFDLHAGAIACDLHPEYLTSKWAAEQSALAKPPLPLKKVQHHHAHIVSAMAESGIEDACLGIAFDGTGYGADGNIWGGEVLISNRKEFERFINFAYTPMPGGAAAIKNPLRMAYGVLWEFDLLEKEGAKEALEQLGEDQAQVCETMIEQGINTPVTSSVGRLFDAASALLGVCTEPAYEGEAAILLEAALWSWLDGEAGSEDVGFATRPDVTSTGAEGGAERSFCDAGQKDSSATLGMTSGRCEAAPSPSAYAINVVKNTATPESTAQDTSVLLFDAAPTFEALLDDKAAGVPTGLIAKRFHDAFVGAIVQAAQLAEALYGMRTVVLSGGVFMNRYLVERAIAALADAGFTVVLNRELPPNDGCISLGQAVVAAERIE